MEQNFYLDSLRHHKASENSLSYSVSASCNYYHEEHCLMWKPNQTKPNYPLILTSYLWRSKPRIDNQLPYNPPYSMFLFCFLFFPVKASAERTGGCTLHPGQEMKGTLGLQEEVVRSITHRLYLILSHALLIQSQFLRIRSLAACSFIPYQLGKWSNASLSKSPLWMRSDCDFWSGRRIWWAWWLGGLWHLLQGNQTQMSLILKSWTV